jgi:NADH dehydrogenase
VKGAPLGTVYCIGDASTIETNLTDHLWELLDLCDENKEYVDRSTSLRCAYDFPDTYANFSGKINFNEFETMLKRIRRLFPTSQIHIEKVRDVFEKYDGDHDGNISTNELAEMFQKLSNSMTALPAVSRVDRAA